MIGREEYNMKYGVSKGGLVHVFKENSSTNSQNCTKTLCGLWIAPTSFLEEPPEDFLLCKNCKRKLERGEK